MFPIHDDNQRLHGRPYINYILILVNIVVFILEISTTNFFSNETKVEDLFISYGSVPEFVLKGDYFTLFTSMFMHGGVAHLIGNMVFLYIFGDNIEDRFGHIKYLLLYLLWGVVAGLAHAFYAVETGAGFIPAVGASGAISGVLGAYLILFPKAKIVTVITTFFLTTVRIPALAYIPFWFIMQVMLSFSNSQGGVAYLAHIGGFVAGLGIAYLLKTMRFFDFTIPSKSFYYQPKQRPIVDDFKLLQPEIIESDKYYEILIDLPSFSDSNNIVISFESDNILLLKTKANTLIKKVQLPHPIANHEIHSAEYLNGILKIRIPKN